MPRFDILTRSVVVPHVKLIWGAGKVIRGRWRFGLFGFYAHRRGLLDSGLAVSIRGVLLWSASLGLGMYLAGASALFCFWQRNPYNLLTWGDAVLWPLRREEVSVKKGQAWIAEGMDVWRSKKYHEAVRFLQMGLKRSPRDVRARMTLAQYYLLAKNWPRAITTFQEGLRAEFPGRLYLQAFFDTAEQGGDYGLVARVAERYRTQPMNSRDALWLGSREFSALLLEGHTMEALALATAQGLGNTASEQRTLALLALGRTDEALTFLENWRDHGGDLFAIARLQVRALREAKRFDEMEDAVSRLHGLSIGPAPLVFGVVQEAMAGRDTEAHQRLEYYIFRFGSTPANLKLIAEPLGDVGAVALVERCAAAATERGYPAGQFQMALVQANLQRGKWSKAAAILLRMNAPPGSDAPTWNLWHDWMTRITGAALSPAEANQAAVIEFMRGRSPPLSFFQCTIDVMRRSGRMKTARDVVSIASAMYPKSAWLKMQSDEIARVLKATP